jgi:hypothetical protein
VARFRGLIQRTPLLRGLMTGRNSCVLHCDAKPQNGHPIFVAIHGTWATRAGWTQRDSKLLTIISNQWPSAGIYRFEWSGVNGARHRLVAADVLAARLDDLASLYTSSSIVTIAHSHGGNVAAWASTQLERPLHAAIYLNTPFIQVLRDSNVSHVMMRIALFVLMLPFLLVSALMASLLFPKSWLILLIAMGIALLPLVLLQRAILRRIDAIRDRLVHVSNGVRKVSKELVVFVVGDEPSAALGAVYIAQWLGRKGLTWLVFIAMIFGIAALFPSYIPANRWDQMSRWLVGGWFAILYVTLALAVSAYGMVHGLVSLDSTVAVTPAPTGEMDIATVGWTDKDQLRHSLIYGSPEAITMMIIWLHRILAQTKA